jgi:hypothetical protein
LQRNDAPSVVIDDWTTDESPNLPKHLYGSKSHRSFDHHSTVDTRYGAGAHYPSLCAASFLLIGIETILIWQCWMSEQMEQRYEEKYAVVRQTCGTYCCYSDKKNRHLQAINSSKCAYRPLLTVDATKHLLNLWFKICRHAKF